MEMMPASLQKAANFPPIVDFPVENRVDLTICRNKRLLPVLTIHDGEASHPAKKRATVEAAFSVRTAMMQCRQHPLKLAGS
jgi:hypothetical protein